MKIFHIAPVRFDRPSGVSVYTVSLLNALVKMNAAQVGLLSNLPVDPLTTGINEKIISLASPVKNHWNPWAVDAQYLNSILGTFGHPDLVHFHGVYYPFQCALARQMLKKGWKYIFSPHGGLQPGSQRRKSWKKFFGNILFFDEFVRHASAVHVLNQAESETVKQRYPGIKTMIVPNGVSSDLLSVSSAEIKKNEPLKFGFIGRIDINHKGVDWLLGALLLLEKSNPSLLWQLVLAGNFFTLKDERIVLGMVKQFKDPQRIILTGNLEGKTKWNTLSSFDVFLHPSRYEGMPTAVIEAMAFGKPCLVTPGTNMQKIISECQGGWCCDGTPESIAMALKMIIENRHEISQRGMNARKYVCDYLTWDEIAGHYIQEAEKLINV